MQFLRHAKPLLHDAALIFFTIGVFLPSARLIAPAGIIFKLVVPVTPVWVEVGIFPLVFIGPRFRPVSIMGITCLASPAAVAQILYLLRKFF